jgi:hypothetical protein
MLHRPDLCPFCGLVPRPDYVSKEADCGTICYCPGCENIVFVVPQGTVYEHMGRAYCLPVNKPFMAPSEFAAYQVKAMTIEPLMDLDELFMDIVDNPGAVFGGPQLRY